MSAVLIAVILALVVGHAVPALAQARRYEWLAAWLAWLGARFNRRGLFASRFGVLISLGLPLVVIGVLQALVDDRAYGLPGFALALVVLFYFWGPRDLELDVEAVVEAGAPEQRRAAAQNLLGPERILALDAPSLVEAVFIAALERWFGVLLWFLLLGPFGALMYRLTQFGSARDIQTELPLDHGDAFRRLKAILDWPVAQLMTLGLALVANFDAVFGAWRGWFEARGDGYFVLDTGFLPAAARVSVACELAEEQDEEFVGEGVVLPPAPLPALRDAMSLAWRVLLLWLVVLALFVLAGYVN
jgi:AmpE protein